jgi:hypothetical protein
MKFKWILGDLRMFLCVGHVHTLVLEGTFLDVFYLQAQGRVCYTMVVFHLRKDNKCAY